MQKRKKKEKRNAIIKKNGKLLNFLCVVINYVVILMCAGDVFLLGVSVRGAAVFPDPRRDAGRSV